MKKILIWTGAALLVVITYMTIQYNLLNQHHQNEVRGYLGFSKIISQIEFTDTLLNSQPMDEKITNDTISIYVPEAPTAIKSKKERIYRVITASFRKESMAIDYINIVKLHTGEYYNMEILEQTDDGFYRVSLIYYYDYKQAINLIEEFKADSVDSWLLRDSI